MKTGTRRVMAVAAMLLAAGLLAPRAEAVENTATNSGNWEAEGTWSAGLPQSNHDVVIPTNITVTINGLATNSINSLTITGTLMHAANAASEANKIVLDVAGDVTIASNGAINVSGRGYSTGGPGSGYGGAHGGEGGGNYGTTYGSITEPTDLGGRGTRGSLPGGGAVRLTAGGTVTINGEIRANGQSGSTPQDGGAGGSIYITASSFEGSGALRANGGDATDYWFYGGGGGRIAVVLTGSDTFGSVTFSAIGGTKAWVHGAYGAAGTIYLKGLNDTYGKLVVSNNLTTTASTLIGANVTDAVVGDVTLLNLGRLNIANDRTLTVHGNWSNATANAVGGGGSVTFAGATPSMLYGNTTFNRFVCQTPGKTLQFEAGKTNTALLALTIAGDDVSPVSLLPATAGQQWFIKGTNTMSPPPAISYVVVSNSTAVTSANGQALTATFSTLDDVGVDNSLNSNTNWSFPAPAHKEWNGSVNTSWANDDNWTPSGVPQETDLSITIPATANQPTLDINRSYSFHLTVSNGAVLSLGSKNLTLGGALTNAGTIVATAGETLTLLSDVNFTVGGSYTAAQSTFRLAGSGPQTFTANGSTFHALNIANTNAITVTDGFTVRDLTFPSNTATVAFGGGFNATNVTLVVTNGATLTFTQGQIYNVLNALVLSGTDGKPIVMNDAAGLWALNVGAYASVKHVNVNHSNAGGGRTIYAVNSTDGGNNPNWNFGAGKLWVGTTTSWTNDANWLPAGAPVSTNVVLLDGAVAVTPRLTNATTIAGLTVAGVHGAAALTVDMPYSGGVLTVTGSVYVATNGTLTHTANSATPAQRLALDVGNNLTIASGGAINVSGRGYSTGGPGSGQGGAHGGEGGNNFGTTYGSITEPTDLGGRGTRGSLPGGGAVRLTAGGTVTINGEIRANGQSGSTPQDGGAGGSIYITASSFEGSGALRANGGDATDYWFYGGGGGRIAVVLTGSDTFGSVTFSAIGGWKALVWGAYGAAGTIYLQTASQAGGKGTVTINNAGRVTGARTHIPPAISPTLDELRYASIIVTNYGALAVTVSDRIQSLSVVTANEPLNLGTNGTVLTLNTMTITNTTYTKGGLYTTNNWNGFTKPTNVTGDGAILLLQPSGSGTVFTIR